MNISMKLVYQYMAIFFYLLTTSNHLHSLQIENCDSNSRLVVDKDDNGKLRIERVKPFFSCCAQHHMAYLRRKMFKKVLKV